MIIFKYNSRSNQYKLISANDESIENIINYFEMAKNIINDRFTDGLYCIDEYRNLCWLNKIENINTLSSKERNELATCYINGNYYSITKAFNMLLTR